MNTIHDFEVAREGNAKTALDAPKPASVYVDIPDWLEAEIMALDGDSLALFASDLGLSLQKGEWEHYHSIDPFTYPAYEWLESQSRDVFKALLQWVAMELI